MTPQPRTPNWDLGRFLKTLSDFGAVPGLSRIGWFQQWFGNQPNPIANSQPIADRLDALPLAGRRLGLLGADGLAQSIAQELSVQGYQIFPVTSEQNSEPIPAIDALLVCDALAQLPDLLDRWLASGQVWGLSQVLLFDFTQPPPEVQQMWGAVDDVVMGGVSESRLQFGEGVATFGGTVSTANSGGFASVRTRNFAQPIDLSRYVGITLRLKGDGNRYKFMLRTEANWDGIAYCYSFDTQPDRWMTIQIPFSDLVPVFRAKTVADRALQLQSVCAFQLMLSKFEYDGALNPHFTAGAFALQIQSIAAYAPKDSAALILARSIAAPLPASGLSKLDPADPQLDSDPDLRSALDFLKVQQIPHTAIVAVEASTPPSPPTVAALTALVGKALQTRPLGAIVASAADAQSWNLAQLPEA